MANVVDLASLSDVKNYLKGGLGGGVVVPGVDDAILSTYLTSVSSWIARYLGRIKGTANLLVAQAWNEVRNGNGARQMRLRARPIVSVTSVVIEQSTLTSAQGKLVGPTYVWDDQYVMLRGGMPVSPAYSIFPRGMLNIQFSYLGGYNTPGMGAVAALPDWAAATQYLAGTQINHAATGLVYTALNGGVSGAVSPAFPTTLGAQVADGTGQTLPIQSIVESGSLVTITTMNPHGLSPGQPATISNVSLAGYNGTFPIQATPTPTTFSYVAPAAGLGPGAGGNVIVPGLIWQATGQALPLVAGASPLPQEITLACVQETALVYKDRGRTGDKSFGEGPSRVDFMIEGISKGTKLLLAPHIDYASAMEGGEIAPAWAA